MWSDVRGGGRALAGKGGVHRRSLGIWWGREIGAEQASNIVRSTQAQELKHTKFPHACQLAADRQAGCDGHATTDVTASRRGGFLTNPGRLCFERLAGQLASQRPHRSANQWQAMGGNGRPLRGFATDDERNKLALARESPLVHITRGQARHRASVAAASAAALDGHASVASPPSPVASNPEGAWRGPAGVADETALPELSSSWSGSDGTRQGSASASSAESGAASGSVCQEAAAAAARAAAHCAAGGALQSSGSSGMSSASSLQASLAAAREAEEGDSADAARSKDAMGRTRVPATLPPLLPLGQHRSGVRKAPHWNSEAAGSEADRGTPPAWPKHCCR